MVHSSIDDLPPFPEDLNLAPIARISCRKLLDGDEAEEARVLEAARTYGFFYLDLRDTAEGEALLADAEQLLAVARTAFSAPMAEKMRYHRRKGVSLFGYKEAGTVKKTDRDRRPDTTEFFNVAKDHAHGVTPPRDYPPVIAAGLPTLFRDFTARGHACGLLVLRALAVRMGLPSPDAFADLNRVDRPSGDHCRLTRKFPHASSDAAAVDAIGLPSHTDFGSVTILFNWLGGLQIESRTEGRVGEWEWVKPMAGHAVVNLGDAMVKFTNGALKSAKHRVVPAPGAQADLDRYSVVYFVRPHDDALMKPLPAFENSNGNGAPPLRVAGKFSAADDVASRVYTAGEWMRLRSIQLMDG